MSQDERIQGTSGVSVKLDYHWGSDFKGEQVKTGNWWVKNGEELRGHRFC